MGNQRSLLWFAAGCVLSAAARISAQAQQAQSDTAPRAYWDSLVLSDEVRAQAAQSQPDIPTIDISRMRGYETEIVEGPDKKLIVEYNRIERTQHVVIADGPKDKIPYGYPSMILLPDGKTMLACTMWPPHKGHRNYGILYHMQDKTTGKGRIWCFGGWPMKRILSEDSGETWKDMSTLPFRCTVVLNTMVRLDNGNYVAWVGTFDDLRNNRPGQYRIKLLHQHTDMYGAKLGDTGYGGIVQLPDGTIVAATYVVYQRQELAEGERSLHSMVSNRFKLSETDALAGLTKQASPTPPPASSYSQ